MPPPVVLMNSLDTDSRTVEDLMRLAMSLSFRGARDVIQKPLPTGGRTLERVIRKVLRREQRRRAECGTGGSCPTGKEQGGGTEKNQESWLTVKEAAMLLMQDLPHLDLDRARSRVSTGASRNQFISHGKRLQRRIEPNSFAAWRLKVRDRDLDKDDPES